MSPGGALPDDVLDSAFKKEPAPAALPKPRARSSYISGTFGEAHEGGVSGFGDAMSHALIRGAVNDSITHMNGAVRHGPEAFNYYWPQEADDEYLIIWDGLPRDRVQWINVSHDELGAFLLARVKEGFAFPMNPKWVLCYKGWYQIFETMLQTSPAAVDAWFPPSSGLRERLAEVAAKFPDGFVRLADETSPEAAADGSYREAESALGQLALKRYQTLQRARFKVRRLRAQCPASPPARALGGSVDIPRGAFGTSPCAYSRRALLALASPRMPSRRP